MMKDSQYFDNWTVQMRKGWLEYCILGALEVSDERYGYDLVRELVNLPGLGVTEGTLYPLLSRLRVQGLVTTRLVESPEGPARKYYSLTDKGRRTSAMMRRHVEQLIEETGNIRRREDSDG